MLYGDAVGRRRGGGPGSKDALDLGLEARRQEQGEPVGALDARLVLGDLGRVHAVSGEGLGELGEGPRLREGAADLF